MKPFDQMLVFAWVLAFGLYMGDRVDVSPSPGPEPSPVESPFPAEGFWLLLSAEAGELSGVESVSAAAFLREELGLSHRAHDFDQDDIGEPWQTALAWAKQRGGGQPYYVLRHGGKASEGPLPDTPEAIDAVVRQAIEGVR